MAGVYGSLYNFLGRLLIIANGVNKVMVAACIRVRVCACLRVHGYVGKRVHLHIIMRMCVCARVCSRVCVTRVRVRLHALMHRYAMSSNSEQDTQHNGAVWFVLNTTINDHLDQLHTSCAFLYLTIGMLIEYSHTKLLDSKRSINNYYVRYSQTLHFRCNSSIECQHIYKIVPANLLLAHKLYQMIGLLTSQNQRTMYWRSNRWLLTSKRVW